MTELKIIEVINKFGQGTIIDWLTVAISSLYLLVPFWIVISLIILARDRKNGRTVILAIIIALALHFLTRWLAADIFGFRVRPFIAFPNLITPIGPTFSDTSFPSGHMMSLAAILTPIIYYYRKLWPYAVFLILAMAFARVHNGVHYPSDVLGGTILGLGFGFIGIALSKKLTGQRNKERLDN